MVNPVESSAIAGATGARSFRRSFDNPFSRPASVFAFRAARSARVKGLDTRIGTFDSDSAPPAITVSACPDAIASAAPTIAWFDDAHARDTV